MLDKATVMKIAEEYSQEVIKNFSPDFIVLFGSYAKGSANDDSDINIAVIFNHYDGNWLKDSAMLWKIAQKKCVEIEPILLDTENDISGFVANIFETGYTIFQKR